ncbi:hypothetical protein [Acetobacter sp.]|uniref:hypothetical protein n=1 Tax=Acetobacter sp. TaxID=440 RepID=UPI0039EA1315
MTTHPAPYDPTRARAGLWPGLPLCLALCLSTTSALAATAPTPPPPNDRGRPARPASQWHRHIP